MKSNIALDLMPSAKECAESDFIHYHRRFRLLYPDEGWRAVEIMPYIETLDDIVEEFADLLGVYNAHGKDCTEHRPCRVCWAAAIHERLVQALRNENQLTA